MQFPQTNSDVAWWLSLIYNNLSGLTQAVSTTTYNQRSEFQLIGQSFGVNISQTGDTQITLTGGTTYMVTDVIITNANQAITTAADGIIQAVPNRGGISIVTTDNGNTELLQTLGGSQLYINNYAGIVINGNTTPVGLVSNFATCNSPLYWSIGTPQLSVPATTIDIYIFGFVLN